MKRVLPLFLGVLLLTAPAFAQAKAGDKAAGKTISATGTVTAVTADSVTVKGKDGEWTFAVDKATTVVAKGGSRKMTSLKADKKPAVVTEFVSVGDDVSVKYHDMGSSKHAATVTVRVAAPKK
jgi:hypothetical protein